MNNKSSKRRNAVIAAVTGAALFMGGSTYALWSSNARIQGGEVAAGDLNLQAGPLTTWDVSRDRTDWQGEGTNAEGKITIPATLGTNNQTIVPAVTLQSTSYMDPNPWGYPPGTSMPYGHQIKDTDTWRMTPGDMVAMALPVKVTLVGDNLVAALSFYMEDQVDANGENYKQFCTGLMDTRLHPNVTYQLFGDDGVALGGIGALCADGVHSGFIEPIIFQARNEGQDDGTWEDGIGPNDEEPMPMATVGEDGTATVVLMIYLTFWEGVGGEDYVNDMLYDFGAGVHASLVQIRCRINDWKDWEENPIYPNNFTTCPTDPDDGEG